MKAFLDTNVLVRYFTDDPPEQAERAERLLRGANELLLPDMIVAEIVYVLQRVYRTPRPIVAARLRSALAFGSIITTNPALLLRALQVYEEERLAFADSYLVAQAEATGVGAVASFDKGIGRVSTVERVEPA